MIIFYATFEKYILKIYLRREKSRNRIFYWDRTKHIWSLHKSYMSLSYYKNNNQVWECNIIKSAKNGLKKHIHILKTLNNTVVLSYFLKLWYNWYLIQFIKFKKKILILKSFTKLLHWIARASFRFSNKNNVLFCYPTISFCG